MAWVARVCRSWCGVTCPIPAAFAFTWQLNEDRVASHPLNQSSQCSRVIADDQVTFPVPRLKAMLDMCGSVLDHQLVLDNARPGRLTTVTTNPTRTLGSKAPLRLAINNTLINGLVDRLRTDPHPRIVRILPNERHGGLGRRPELIQASFNNIPKPGVRREPPFLGALGTLPHFGLRFNCPITAAAAVEFDFARHRRRSTPDAPGYRAKRFLR